MPIQYQCPNCQAAGETVEELANCPKCGKAFSAAKVASERRQEKLARSELEVLTSIESLLVEQKEAMKDMREEIVAAVTNGSWLLLIITGLVMWGCV